MPRTVLRPTRSERKKLKCQRVMEELRREAETDPIMAGILAEIDAKEAQRKSAGKEFSTDFPTSPVENLDAGPATTSLASRPIFPPQPPVSGLGGGKVRVAREQIGSPEARELSTQVSAAQSVAVSGELLDAGGDGGQQARLNHHQGQSGGGKIIELGDLFILPGESPEQSLVVPKQRVQRGRPRAVDNDMQTRIVSLMSAGLSLRQVAAKVGVHHTTIMDAMRRDREFAEQVSEARTEGVSQPLAVVIKAARTNWRAAAWLAKHLQSQFYKGDCPPEERALERK